MRSLPVELDEETFEALEMERRLIGFDSRAAYVRWIVEYRASITEEADGAERILEAYRERIIELEARLAERADRDGRCAQSTDHGPESASDEERDESAAADPPADTAADAGDGATVPNESRPRADADGRWTRSKSHPSIEVRGSPRTTVSRDRTAGADDATGATGAATEADPGATSNNGNGDGGTKSGSTGADASGLAPERVVRISEDPVSEDADVLDTVEFDRLDELSRRAVAKTRSRLNRPVETGLEYRSSTTLVDETIRPGEDVVDLDSLSVPGHDDDVIEARREVAGRAIAFLRDEERARKSDFVDALYAAHPAGYETADSWWTCLKRALKQVDAIGGGDGSRIWRFTG